jgi:hypothetical protein
MLLRRNYRISFKVLWPLLIKYGDFGVLKNWDYGVVRNYQQQDFAWEEMVADGNQWMMVNPLMSPKNARRIKKIVKRLRKK